MARNYDAMNKNVLRNLESRNQTQYLKCIQCGGLMVKAKKVIRNIMLQIFAIILFFVGAALLFAFPIGTIAGAAIIIGLLATRLGYTKNKVWKCNNCGYFFEKMQ